MIYCINIHNGHSENQAYFKYFEWEVWMTRMSFIGINKCMRNVFYGQLSSLAINSPPLRIYNRCKHKWYIGTNG